MEPWVFFDVGNLVWRAYHTTGKKGLSHGGTPTGVTYGFLREVKYQLDKHQTPNGVFCFDSKKESVRKKQFAGYKAKRHAKEYTPEQEAEYKMVQQQVRLLKKDYLPSLGFKNLLEYDGFEADDAIALGVYAVRHMAHAVRGEIDCHIVSSDKDLLQLLAFPNVTCWRPGVEGAATTKEGFEGEWGVHPALWTCVKAIAGCSSDEIPGVVGVGEKTAASYLRKTKEKTDGTNLDVELTKKEREAFEFTCTDRYKENMALVTLPHRELKAAHLYGANLNVQMPVTARAWNKLFSRLGIRSIV